MHNFFVVVAASFSELRTKESLLEDGAKVAIVSWIQTNLERPWESLVTKASPGLEGTEGILNRR